MSGCDEPPKPIVSPDSAFAVIAAFKAAGDAFDIAYDAEESADDRNRRAAQLALDAASDTLKATREALLNDPPTTFEGLAALLEFAATVPDIAEWLIHASDHVEKHVVGLKKFNVSAQTEYKDFTVDMLCYQEWIA
jgi:hypothetical protein